VPRRRGGRRSSWIEGSLKKGSIPVLEKDSSVWERHKNELATRVCRSCPFFAEDCDYQGKERIEDAEPCGGFILLALWYENGPHPDGRRGVGPCRPASGDRLTCASMARRPSNGWRIPSCNHVLRDELYEIDNRALDFLATCDGTRTGDDLAPDPAFVEYCIAEGLLETLTRPERVTIR